MDVVVDLRNRDDDLLKSEGDKLTVEELKVAIQGQRLLERAAFIGNLKSPVPLRYVPGLRI